MNILGVFLVQELRTGGQSAASAGAANGPGSAQGAVVNAGAGVLPAGGWAR